MMKQELERLHCFFPSHGGVAIDIGAHVGNSTIPMALLAERTIAFDPNPAVYEVLETNAQLNPHLNIEAHNYGIALQAGTLELEHGGDTACNGDVPGFGKAGNKPSLVVNLREFLLKEHGADIIKQISYIKTDAEGFDHQIISYITPLVQEICQKSPNGCPVIQVKWREYFKSGATSTVNEGTHKLLDAITDMQRDTPAYEKLCTFPCAQTGVACDLKPMVSGMSKALCPDILLKPVKATGTST